MYRMRFRININTTGFIPFAIGFFLGFMIMSLDFSSEQISSSELYETDMADRLIPEIRILCLIFTHPKNHKTKAVIVRDTWGRKCTKLLFVTSQDDDELETLTLKVNESRMALRNKTRESFLYLNREYINDFDWFMKADDDSFVVMENLRYMLYQFRARTALFFGHRFAVPFMDEGYMSGATYILSRPAVIKFAHKIARANSNDPFFKDGQGEDVNMGRILGNEAIFVDCRDENKQKRFFPLSVTNHFKPLNKSSDYWYTKTLYYNVSDGNLNCCSDVPISFHYSSGGRNVMLEYLLYHLHPFGINKESRFELPKKFSLDEIIKASDAESHATNFIKHKDVHDIESYEKF